jgi:hypothetical protein
MDHEVLWPEVATVAIVAAQLLVLVAAAIVARHQVLEARRLREQQSRPFVIIDFDIERGVEVYLQVANLGNSLAREVTFEITPPLESSIDVPVDKIKMFTEGIAPWLRQALPHVLRHRLPTSRLGSADDL